MALTKAQWLTKLKLWVPGNLFEEEKLQLAHWSGIAAVLEHDDLVEFAKIVVDQHRLTTPKTDKDGHTDTQRGGQKSDKRAHARLG